MKQTTWDRFKIWLVIGVFCAAVLCSLLAALIEGLGRIIALWKYILG